MRDFNEFMRIVKIGLNLKETTIVIITSPAKKINKCFEANTYKFLGCSFHGILL